MPPQGELIREPAEKLERQLIIDDLTRADPMEGSREYIEKLRAK